MPLRTRLVLAFVILIVSSASATIMIGNTVFGRKFDEIASDLVAVYVRLAAQALDERLERMRLAAGRLSQQVGARAAPPDPGENVEPDVPVDFVILYSPSGTSTLRHHADPGVGRANTAPFSVLTPADAAVLLRGSPGPVMEKAMKEGAAAAGIGAASGGEAARLTGSSASGGTLLALAAAPPSRAGSPAVLLGYVLNGRAEVLEQARRLIPSERSGRLVVSLYLEGRPIASLGGDGAFGESKLALAVPGAADLNNVLSRAFDGSFYAAYFPLRDISGRLVAVLGVGSGEVAVADVRRRTIVLFSSLIAGGMVFGFIMTWLFSSWLVSPISQLAEGMSRVAEGDLNYKVRIQSAGELGKLAAAFNQMVRAVKERDLKLREMTESRLTQVEKQVSIGRLAAGVAHEINNPLTAILSLSSLALKKIPAGDPRREDLEIVVSETSRCRDIVRNLLDFARERPMEKQPVDVNAVVLETVPLAKRYESLGQVQIELKLGAGPLVVNADANMLQQVFMNLLLNAGEATGRGGSVIVETDEDSSGHFIQVRIVDRGKGIPKEHINRVFEPFFTTKAAGKGTGLGLSVSLGIVQKHDGTIEIESVEGQGTRLTVLLPRFEEPKP